MARKPSKGKLPYSVAEVAEHSIGMRKIQELFPHALTVTDADREKVLMVTAEDVSRAQPGDPSSCAVARCAEREGLGGMIGRKFAFLIRGSEVTRYQLGKDAQVRTAIFDDRGTMTPGPVLLNVPALGERLGSMSKRVNLHVADKKKNRTPNSKKAKSNRKRSEAVRQVIATHGFRSWNQAGAMLAGR